MRRPLTQPVQSQRRTARRVKKNSSTYYINLATALQKRGRIQRALDVIEAASGRFRNDRHTVFCKSRILRHDGQLDAAYAAFKTGLEMNSHTPEYEDLVLGGNLALRLALIDDGLALFKRAVARNPFKPAHHLVYIDALVRHARWEEGIAASGAALLRFPQNATLLARLEKLEQGQRRSV